MKKRTCVRNQCNGAECQCKACTPRKFDPKRDPREPQPPCTCTLSPHKLVMIEEVWTKTGLQHRYVCSCGVKGIPVGSAAVPGEDWARGAFGWHAAKIDYDSPPAGFNPRGTP